MNVRFYRKPADAERNAGAVMLEQTMVDHTSAGVKPSVAADVATDKDKTAHAAAWLAFVASESPAGAVEDVQPLAAAAQDLAPAATARGGKKKR